MRVFLARRSALVSRRVETLPEDESTKVTRFQVCLPVKRQSEHITTFERQNPGKYELNNKDSDKWYLRYQTFGAESRPIVGLAS